MRKQNVYQEEKDRVDILIQEIEEEDRVGLGLSKKQKESVD